MEKKANVTVPFWYIVVMRIYTKVDDIIFPVLPFIFASHLIIKRVSLPDDGYNFILLLGLYVVAYDLFTNVPNIISKHCIDKLYLPGDGLKDVFIGSDIPEENIVFDKDILLGEVDRLFFANCIIGFFSMCGKCLIAAVVMQNVVLGYYLYDRVQNVDFTITIIVIACACLLTAYTLRLRVVGRLDT